MAITFVASASVRKTTTGGGDNISTTITIPALTNGYVAIAATVRNAQSNATWTSVVFNGQTCVNLVERNQTSGLDNVRVAVFGKAVGNLGAGTYTVAVNSSGDGYNFVGFVVSVYSGVLQSDAGQGNSSSNAGSGGGSPTISNIVSSTDQTVDAYGGNTFVVVGVLFDHVLNGQESTNVTDLGFVASSRWTQNTSQVTWNGGNTGLWALCSVALKAGSSGGGAPTLTSTQSTNIADMPPNLVRPGDTTATILGSNFSVGNVTAYLGNSATFATATKVLQPLASVTTTTANWTPTLGALTDGVLYLFIVNDEGGAGEGISTGLPVIVSDPDIRFQMVNHETPSTNSTVVIPFEDLKAAVIFSQGSVTLDSNVTGFAQSYAAIDSAGNSSAIATTTRNASTQIYREQLQGSLHVNILSTTSQGVTIVGATASITSAGLSLNYTTTNGANFPVGIALFGGKTMRSKVGVVQVTAGTATGVGFKSNFIDVFANGLTFGTTSDTVASVTSHGKSNGSAQQHAITSLFGSSVQPNRGSSTTWVAGQQNTSAVDWSAAITSITSNGFSWSGTNSDSMSYLCLYLDGAKTARGAWQKSTSGSTNLTESLPAFGFKPALMFFNSAVRVDISQNATNSGVASLGITDGSTTFSTWGVTTKVVTFTARMRASRTVLTNGGFDPTVAPAITGELVSFNDPPQVRWTTNTPNALYFFYFAFESLTPVLGPTISTVFSSNLANMPNGLVRPTDTGVAVTGLRFNPGGTTAVYLGDNRNYAVATKVPQAFSGLTSTSLTWSAVNLGGLTAGWLYLFVVTGQGGASERVNDGFLVNVHVPDLHYGMVHVQIPAATGLQTIPFDKCRGALIFTNDAFSRDANDGDASWATFVIASNGKTAGYSAGVSNNTTTVRREQLADVAGSFFVLRSASINGTKSVQGTATIDDAGLHINYTLLPGGNHWINVFLVGGQTCYAAAGNVAASAGAVTGLAFRPNFFFATSVNWTFGQTVDATNALMAFGWAAGPTTGGTTTQQLSMQTEFGSQDPNRVGSRDGFMIQSNSANGFTYQLTLTGFTSDGWTWSGANADGFGYLAWYTDGGRVFSRTETTPNPLVVNDLQTLSTIGWDPEAVFFVSQAKAGWTATDTAPSTMTLGAASTMNGGGQGSTFVIAQGTGNRTANQRISGSNVMILSRDVGTIPQRQAAVENVSSLRDPIQLRWNTVAVGNVTDQFAWVAFEKLPQTIDASVFFSFAMNV